MLVFSQALNQSLSRAIAQAEQQCYSCATPEHVVLALLDDPDVIPVMRACGVDREKLRSAVLASMPHWQYEDLDEPDDTPADGPDSECDEDESDEAPDEDGRIPIQHFEVDLQRAIAHARSSGCEEVNSADMLVAMLNGPAGGLLNQHGLTRYDVTTFICHGIGKKAQATTLRDVVEPASSDATAGSSNFRVRFLNDNYTPMDFVLYVLQQVFQLEAEDAEKLVLRIHHEGAGTCGNFTRDGAEARAARVHELAREHQHPLRCCIER